MFNEPFHEGFRVIWIYKDIINCQENLGNLLRPDKYYGNVQSNIEHDKDLFVEYYLLTLCLIFLAIDSKNKF